MYHWCKEIVTKHGEFYMAFFSEDLGFRFEI